MNSSHEIETQQILPKKKPTEKEEQPKSDRWQRERERERERENVELEPPQHGVEFKATTLCI